MEKKILIALALIMLTAISADVAGIFRITCGNGDMYNFIALGDNVAEDLIQAFEFMEEICF